MPSVAHIGPAIAEADNIPTLDRSLIAVIQFSTG